MQIQLEPGPVRKLTPETFSGVERGGGVGGGISYTTPLEGCWRSFRDEQLEDK